MDTVILSSVIGGSAVVVATLMGVIFNRIFNAQEKTNNKLTVLTDAIQTLDTKVTGEIKDLEIRLTDKFTGEIKAQGERIDRVHDVVRDHSGRLARIEAKLDIDPPAEAA